MTWPPDNDNFFKQLRISKDNLKIMQWQHSWKLYLLTITSKKIYVICYMNSHIFIEIAIFLLFSYTFLIVFLQMSPLLNVKNTLVLSILWNLVIVLSSLNKSAKSWHNSTQISPTLGAYSASRRRSGGVGLKNCCSSLGRNHCNEISASYGVW